MFTRITNRPIYYILSLCLLCGLLTASVFSAYAMGGNTAESEPIKESAPHTQASEETETVDTADPTVTEAADEVLGPDKPKNGSETDASLDTDAPEAEKDTDRPDMEVETEDSTPKYESVPLISEDLTLPQGRLIGRTTYVPLRDLCTALDDCQITWEDPLAVVTVGEYRIEVPVGAPYIVANGRYLCTGEPAVTFEEDGVTYVPLRSIAKALGFAISWEEETRSVVLTDTDALLSSGDEFYSQDDLYWLSRIISAESRGEPLLGKIAVGNVVLNRVVCDMYPDTVKKVVLDRKHGTQFTPAANGSLYNAPTDESIIAAKICLEGFTLSDRILFFMNPDTAVSAWISKNRVFAFEVGNHSFYY